MDLVTDVRFVARTLIKNPGFTTVAVSILALGIGINVTVFTITKVVLFEGFPQVADSSQILYIDTHKAGRGCCVSYLDFQDWQTQAKAFEGMAAVADLRVTLDSGSGTPERYVATQVSANTFDLLGQKPMIGRDFASYDEKVGAAPVAVLTHGLWERRFGKDPATVGRTVEINGAATTVIGVTPRGFSFPQNQDLWLPMVPTADSERREARSLWFAFGRLGEGETIGSARTELETIGRRLASAYPRTNQGVLPVVRRFDEFFVGPSAKTTYVAMWGAVGFVVLIACANLANLILARLIGRSRENAVRLALGAGRWRVIRHLLIESAMLSALGGVLAFWIATWGLRSYELFSNQPAWFHSVLDYSIDTRVLVYLTMISLGAGLVVGLVPLGRLSRLDVNAVLRRGGRGATDRGSAKLSTSIVIVEVSLAVTLLSGAGVMIRSFLNIYTADLGIRTTNVLTMFLNLPDDRYGDADSRISFYDRLTTRLGVVPGVESVAIAWRPPAGGSSSFPYELAGAPPVDAQSRPTLSALIIGPAYFRTLGAAVLAGREFDHTDGVSGIPAAIVNQRFVDETWPGEDPLGKRLRLFGGNTPGAWLTVVGVVSNIIQNDGTRQEFEPLIYLPHRDRPTGAMWVFVQIEVPPESLGGLFRHEIQAIDPELPIWLGPFTLEDRLRQGYSSNGNMAALFVIFAATALLLASTGLYAVIAHAVNQRAQEIGIRRAIGATTGDILTLVFRQGILPLLIGLTIGLPSSFVMNRVVESQLVGVSAVDPITIAAVLVALVTATTLGCWVPARQAIRTDPVEILRHE